MKRLNNDILKYNSIIEQLKEQKMFSVNNLKKTKWKSKAAKQQLLILEKKLQNQAILNDPKIRLFLKKGIVMSKYYKEDFETNIIRPLMSNKPKKQ